MAGKDIVAKVKADLEFLQDPVWREQILGVLLYGSQATGEAGPRSDIDLCIVAPQASRPFFALEEVHISPQGQSL